MSLLLTSFLTVAFKTSTSCRDHPRISVKGTRVQASTPSMRSIAMKAPISFYTYNSVRIGNNSVGHHKAKKGTYQPLILRPRPHRHFEHLLLDVSESDFFKRVHENVERSSRLSNFVACLAKKAQHVRHIVVRLDGTILGVEVWDAFFKLDPAAWFQIAGTTLTTLLAHCEESHGGTFGIPTRNIAAQVWANRESTRPCIGSGYSRTVGALPSPFRHRLPGT